MTNIQALITSIADSLKPVTYSVSSNLGTSYRQKVVINAATATTQTLPVATAGKEIRISNVGTGLVTVARTGSDTIDGFQNKLLFPTQSALLVCSAAGAWTTAESTNNFRKVIATNVTSNVITMADATGLSFVAFANVTYKFRVEIGYNSVATATGARFSMNGPISSIIRYYWENTLATNTIVQNYYTAFNTVTAGNITSLLTGNSALGYGVIAPTTDGTIVARFASEINASLITVLGGQSFIEWSPIATSIANTGVF